MQSVAEPQASPCQKAILSTSEPSSLHMQPAPLPSPVHASALTRQGQALSLGSVTVGSLGDALQVQELKRMDPQRLFCFLRRPLHAGKEACPYRSWFSCCGSVGLHRHVSAVVGLPFQAEVLHRFRCSGTTKGSQADYIGRLPLIGCWQS